MAEEFVDLYAVLDLAVDADRGTVRKRINERYLDAQRNLDHRNFATRVKFQELFEVTLPQARYILLDDGRRDEYNRLVNAFRSTSGAVAGAPLVSPADAPAAISPPISGGFSLQSAPDPAAEIAPPIAPLPPMPVDAAQLAIEREELWKKWKSGLETALSVEDEAKPKKRGAVTSAPTSFSAATTPETPVYSGEEEPPQTAPVETPVAPQAASTAPAPQAPAPQAPARPKVDISFDFGGDNLPRRGDSAPSPGAEELVAEHKRMHSVEEIEARRTEHRRQITKEILVNVGLIWGIVGAAIIVVPGVVALIAASAHYYPRGAKPLLSYPALTLWSGGTLIILVASFFASRALSKMMRRQKATEISALSYEELLRRNGKS